MASESGTETSKLRTNRTFICSVVFLDIVGYSKKPVDNQIRLKERFNAILAESLRDIPIADRIILDTGDGAAIGFMSDPEDALFVAMSIRDALNAEQEKIDLLVRMGINLGPVKIVKDINNQLNLIGDGINVAQRIMSFAEPGQLLVSRSYYDIVSCLSQEYAQLFQYKGAKADKHIREHDIYSVESSGLRQTTSLHSSGLTMKTQPDRQTDQGEAVPAAQTAAPQKVAPVPTQETPVQKSPSKKYLLMAMPAALVLLLIGVFFLIPKNQDKESMPAVVPQVQPKAAKAAKVAGVAKKAEIKKETGEPPPIAEAKVEEKNISREETVRSKSLKADDIEFTLTGVKRVGEDVTVSVRLHNHAGVSKSVALYDDYVRWPKSKLTDSAGKVYEANKVLFFKGSVSMTSRETGTQGLSLAPGGTATVSLTFNKTGKGIKSFALHPFIYVGRSWKEHDLLLKSGS